MLSWRWDRRPSDGRSRNLALALKHAQERGIKYLFADLVSIDQTAPKLLLLRSVVELANVFASIPVIAAYDEKRGTMEDWSRTLQRPWILSEIRAFCQNPTRVTHVGFRDEPRELSFANEVSVIRSRGYADCILDVLYGYVQMTDPADFHHILAEFTEPVAACYRAFERADYLLAVFLLTAKYERSQTVSRGEANLDYGFRTDFADMMFDSIGLKRFTVGPFLKEARPYESARALMLDGHDVAIWRSKMTSSFDRNWIEILPEMEDHVFQAIGLSRRARDGYRGRPELRTAFLRIDAAAPRPSIDERLASLSRGGWVKEVQPPTGQTVGFAPELWR